MCIRDSVTEAASHIISAGGKRFRPLLVVLASQLLPGAASDRIDRAAIVMELTHVASLYHDDVMDEAAVRRSVDSANARWDNTVAILVGDYLFSRASSTVATLGTEYVALQAETFARLVQGQIAETRGPLPGVDRLQHYLDVVADKTGSLIAASARFGGMVCGASDEILDLSLIHTGPTPPDATIPSRFGPALEAQHFGSPSSEIPLISTVVRQ